MNHYFTNENVKSELKKNEVLVNDKKFCFYTDNGVFSKRKLDYGSRILIETLLKENLSGCALDVGCGYGVIGIIISSFFNNLSFDMVDINKRAIHLTKMNIKENNVNCNSFYSDVYSSIEKKYDVIISNPPIRAGKEIVYKILFEAEKHLLKSGTLYFVMNKDQGAKTAIKDLEKVSKVEVLKKDKGFFVIKCIFD